MRGMVESCVSPSELHLKKELASLRKARFLRDPETSRSCRSPLSSGSLGTFAVSKLNLDDENVENQNGDLFEVPSGFEKRRKKVYLYNWGHHSGKSSDSGLQLGEEKKQPSVEGISKEVLNFSPKVDNLEDAVNFCGVKETKPATQGRRTARKSRKSSVLKKRISRKSATAKMLDFPTGSLGVIKSVEQSDDSGYCSSEELLQLRRKLVRKSSCHSHCGSLSFSGSGCGNWSNSSRLLKIARREWSSHSHTPVSNSSRNRHGGRNPSMSRSRGRGSASFDTDEVDKLEFRRNQRCGLPSCLSKRTKGSGFRSCSSPQSDSSSRSARSVFCGSHIMHHRRRSSGSNKHKYVSKSSQGLPLLSNSFDGGGSSADSVADELATNFGEFDLEATSRLDGRRWSSCRSQEGLQSVLPGGLNLDMVQQKSLSQKYEPSSFNDIVGHDIIVQSLTNAISRGRIAPAYLFQGPRGTGKSSTARVFAAALNCFSTEENRPCGLCSACTSFARGNRPNMREVDANHKKDISTIRLMLKKMANTKFSRYRVFIIDECYMLSSNSWSAFMKFLEEPLPRVIFIFITVDSDGLPRAVVSRCQKYIFPKIKDSDIASRLRRLSAEESLDVELDALDLIASHSDGSLKDAETMLDQLSLLGKKVTTSLVNDLVGVVSNEKLLALLEIALSSDTAETVRRSRELMASGVDPVALMSQLATLIMDIIAGTSQPPSSQSTGIVFGGRSLSEVEIERLQQALKILSDAEKQLRLSSERSTWFTAALLQLGSSHSPQPTPSSSCSSKLSTRKFNGGELEKTKKSSSFEDRSNSSIKFGKSSSPSIPRFTSGRHSISSHRSLLESVHKDDAAGKRVLRCVSPDKLDEIWVRCIKQCDSERLRQLLYTHGKLVSIAETEGALIVYIAFGDGDMKSKAERFLSSITDSVAIVLRHNVEVRVGLVRDKYLKALNSEPDFSSSKYAEIIESKADSNRMHAFLDKDQYGRPPNLPRRSFDYSTNKPQRTPTRLDRSLLQWTSTAAIDEQNLESAWLQVAEKREISSVNHLKQEKNQNLPQNGVSTSFKHWEDTVCSEIEEIETNDSQIYTYEHVGGRAEHYHYAISPSLLHNNSIRADFDKNSVGYESGPVQTGFCCWKTSKHHKEKVKQGDHVQLRRGSLLCIGQCWKSRANR